MAANRLSTASSIMSRTMLPLMPALATAELSLNLGDDD
jgi:hypothetical protein